MKWRHKLCLRVKTYFWVLLLHLILTSREWILNIASRFVIHMYVQIKEIFEKSNIYNLKHVDSELTFNFPCFYSKQDSFMILLLHMFMLFNFILLLHFSLLFFHPFAFFFFFWRCDSGELFIATFFFILKFCCRLFIFIVFTVMSLYGACLHVSFHHTKFTVFSFMC